MTTIDLVQPGYIIVSFLLHMGGICVAFSSARRLEMRQKAVQVEPQSVFFGGMPVPSVFTLGKTAATVSCICMCVQVISIARFARRAPEENSLSNTDAYEDSLFFHSYNLALR